MLCCLGSLKAQVHQFVSMDNLHPAPNAKLPKAKDLSASIRGQVSPDSIIYELEVSDQKLVLGKDAATSDHVEIWFGFDECDFSDFIVADTKGRRASRMFRNSAESGDNADLERFLKLGDYPASGKIQDPASLEWLNAEVPEGTSLRKESVFYGIASYACFPDNRAPVQLNRDKYKYMEDQLFPFDDLSKCLKSQARKTSTGYSIRIALHNSCLLFGVPASMKELRFAVQVHDVDKEGGQVSQFISSAKNNYYARPFYFNKVSLPFALNIHLEPVPDEIIRNMGLRFSVIRSGNTWRPYYYSNGPIIYAPDIMSDAGMVEYEFYPAFVKFIESPAGAEVKWNRLDIEYDDISAFYQHEVYFTVGDSISLSSKEYRYLESMPGDFVNSIFKLQDGSVAAALYDYEPVDPLGWGPLGMTADEFVYIQKLDKKGGFPIFNVGQRVEGTGNVTVGDPVMFRLEQVKSIRYRWIEFGKTFEMLVDSDNPDYVRNIRFAIGADNKVSVIK